jgi:hypothetical protein
MMEKSNIATRVRDVLVLLCPIRWIASAFALIMGLAGVSTMARAESGGRFWQEYLIHASRCEAALNDTGPEGARCLLGNGLKLLVGEGLRSADDYGKTVFGQHFQVVGRVTHSPVLNGIGLQGDLDVVLPFAGAGAALSVGRQGASSLFFQQGMTRSWDGSGLFRNDLRHGMVRRFRLSNAPDADILGISAFHLFNAERGHRVMAPGIDYTGRWGIGSFRYFVPTTGWRPGRLGNEEQALEGFEFGMRFVLTTTLRLNTVGYRWKAEDGSERWKAGARLNLDWRPHPWLKFDVGYDGIGRGEGHSIVQAALHVPFGGSSERPRWEGFGGTADHSPPSISDLWQPVDDVGPIRLAKRKSASALVKDAQVRFLQDSVGSGEEVRLEVLLPAAAPEDIRVVVQLVPGSGKNPAVAGEDFVDEPVETTIRKGTTSGTVSIPLLRNDAMQESRSLSATASLVS